MTSHHFNWTALFYLLFSSPITLNTKQYTKTTNSDCTSETKFILQNETTTLTFLIFDHDLTPTHKLQLIIRPKNDDSDWLVIAVTTVRFLNLTDLCFFVELKVSHHPLQCKYLTCIYILEHKIKFSFMRYMSHYIASSVTVFISILIWKIFKFPKVSQFWPPVCEMLLWYTATLFC